MSYRVELPVFSGPMDLLLHLVRQQEVDIHEISIAKILEHYLQHLNVLETLDLADIGEFVVMAGTLMEIKSRELLPREEVSVDEMLDPRDDLIRRLLEYKRYRDLSRRLDRMGQRRGRMAMPWIPLPETAADRESEDHLDLGDVKIWTLTEAFARLLEATGQAAKTMHVGVEVRTVGFYIDRILGKLRSRSEREVAFEELFERTDGRMGLIGVFIAMLEMMKQGFLRAHQDDCFGPITVVFRGADDVTAQQILARTEAEAEPAGSEVVHPAVPAPQSEGSESAEAAEAAETAEAADAD